jgi:hypothetical protein
VNALRLCPDCRLDLVPGTEVVPTSDKRHCEVCRVLNSRSARWLLHPRSPRVVAEKLLVGLVFGLVWGAAVAYLFGVFG